MPPHHNYLRGANGVHERIRTSDPRIHTTSTFAAAKRSWSGLSLHRGPSRPLGAAHPVSTPSPDFSGAWLGIGMLTSSEAFPDFEQIDCSVSVCNPQLNSGILCSILLSYVDTKFAFRRAEKNRNPANVESYEDGNVPTFPKSNRSTINIQGAVVPG